ncbi:hypothetical protein QQM79_20725 [Marinobacteraceae bacterium S3BR75-40.1]
MTLRIFVVLSFLTAAFLAPISAQSAQLSCSDNSFYLPNAEITRSEGSDYVRHEFAYQQDGSYWTGVVFEFGEDALQNERLKAINRADQGKALSLKLADVTQRNMLDSGIYKQVSGLQTHQIDQRTIITFEAIFEDDKDIYAVYGRWNDGQLQFFRTHTQVKVSSEIAAQTKAAAHSLADIVKNCSFHEA